MGAVGPIALATKDPSPTVPSVVQCLLTDPMSLVEERAALQLANAQARLAKARPIRTAEYLPFVFDQLAEVQDTAGYLKDFKVNFIFYAFNYSWSKPKYYFLEIFI
ncbi:unnamed protein product [Protopolystoma xenopodis]|uniref:Uncharacterized protein n=1 Tax=Protopolystoma xenopodis TaxID=117903 RepID=A0A448XA38_9PLAT|nr:unnamed protein product [Protopolystoma xenopodis]